MNNHEDKMKSNYFFADPGNYYIGVPNILVVRSFHSKEKWETCAQIISSPQDSLDKLNINNHLNGVNGFVSIFGIFLKIKAANESGLDIVDYEVLSSATPELKIKFTCKESGIHEIHFIFSSGYEESVSVEVNALNPECSFSFDDGWPVGIANSRNGLLVAYSKKVIEITQDGDYKQNILNLNESINDISSHTGLELFAIGTSHLKRETSPFESNYQNLLSHEPDIRHEYAFQRSKKREQISDSEESSKSTRFQSLILYTFDGELLWRLGDDSFSISVPIIHSTFSLDGDIIIATTEQVGKIDHTCGEIIVEKLLPNYGLVSRMGLTKSGCIVILDGSFGCIHILSDTLNVLLRFDLRDQTDCHVKVGWTGLAINSQGYIFVSHCTKGIISVYTLNGVKIGYIESEWDEAVWPLDIAVSGSENFFVIDHFKKCIKKYKYMF